MEKQDLEFLRNHVSLDEESRFELNQYLVLLRVLDYKIKESEQIVDELVARNHYARLLTSIPGIAELSALLIAAEIADIRRFPSSKALVSYAGLAPSTYQSGESLKHGSITKQGDKWFRRVLIQAANKAIESNPKPERFYRRIERKKGHNKAIVE